LLAWRSAALGKAAHRFAGREAIPPRRRGGAGTGMGDPIIRGGGLGPTPEAIEDMLREVREALGMDVAFVSEFAGDELVFRALEGDAASFGWREGQGFPLDESYCKRVLDGRVPDVVPDARREDATRDLRVTTEADMGSYCAVPLVLSDGRLYGTLCCVSHEPDPWLRERDLDLMGRTARRLVEDLERLGQL
jgi:transcriptional regulator with GAF, ATPase, and Fis domain